MGVRLESQAEVLGVVDDPLAPRDGLPVDNGSHLQKISHVRHGLRGRILDAIEVKVAALDDELGGGIEEGLGSLMASRNAKPRRKSRVMAAQLEEGQFSVTPVVGSMKAAGWTLLPMVNVVGLWSTVSQAQRPSLATRNLTLTERAI